MRTFRRRSGTALLASALVLLALPAWAGHASHKKAHKSHLAAAHGSAKVDSAADARRFFAAGQKAFDAGRYVDAARAFEDAFHTKPNPAPLINAGDAWQKAGEYAKAAQDFQRVLGLSLSTAQDRADAIARLSHLKPRLGTLKLRGKSSQRVRVDDNEFKGGDQVYVFPGKHKITLVDVDGSRLRTLDISAGAVRTIDLSSLLPAAKSVDHQHETSVGQDHGKSAGGGGIRALTWVAYGVGAIGAAGTVVFGLQANSAANSFDANPNRADYDKFNRHKLLTNISLGVGVVGVGVGTVLLIGDLKRSHHAPQSDTTSLHHARRHLAVAVDVAPLPCGGGMLVTRGWF